MSAKLEEIAAFRALFQNDGALYEYRKSEFIIRPGETPSGIFYIESGLVKAYDITKYGEENVLIIRRHDEVFPLIWALTGQERSVIYEALSPTRVRMVRREVFLDFIENNPNALTVLLDMAIEMYRVHSERIINMGYRNVRERLVSFLLTTAGRFGTTKPNGDLWLGVPLRHQDIGSSISASRETVGREIQILERQKLVSVKDGYITLHDVSKLQNYL
jgi:CRP/FNR family transcriptional regulator